MRAIYGVLLWGLLAGGCTPGYLGAGNTPWASRGRPVELPRSEQFSFSCAANETAYEISLALPEQTAPPSGYRVVYTTDAALLFSTLVATVRAYDTRRHEVGHLPTIVIGIGYPPGVDVVAARSVDLTPQLRGAPVPVVGRKRYETGGADALLDCIEFELMPLIKQRVPVDGTQQALFGHSYGGLFALHALLSRPHLFASYMVVSPSLWYGAGLIAEELSEFRQRRLGRDRVRALIMVGEYDQILRPSLRGTPGARARAAELARRRMVDRAREFAGGLAGVPGVDAAFVEFPGEDHGTVIPAAISRAMWFFLRPGL